MVQLNLQPKFRSEFKQLVGLRRSFTVDNTENAITPKTLKEIAEKVKSQEKNKLIHNMSKQSFITNKKQFLLSRKIFYKLKPQDTTLFKLQRMRKCSKQNTYDELIDQPIQQQDVFNIHKEILNNPKDFHRNMIIRIKDDQQTKGILKQWYNENVTPNRPKQRAITELDKPSINPSPKNSILQTQKFKQAQSPIFARKKTNVFTNERLKKYKSNVNENIIKRNLSFREEKEQNSQNTQKLAKLIVRVQPFWDKVRIKI